MDRREFCKNLAALPIILSLPFEFDKTVKITDEFMKKIPNTQKIGVPDRSVLLDWAAISYADSTIGVKRHPAIKIILSPREYNIFMSNENNLELNPERDIEIYVQEIGPNIIFLSDIEKPEYSARIMLNEELDLELRKK